MCEFAMEDTSVKNLFASNKIVLFLKWVTYGWIKYGFMTYWLCIFLFGKVCVRRMPIVLINRLAIPSNK